MYVPHIVLHYMLFYLFQVLGIFKQLHVTRKKLFYGDGPNLAKARAKINDEFKNHKVVANNDDIPELISVAKEVEQFYRTSVVQAVPAADGRHSMVSFAAHHQLPSNN